MKEIFKITQTTELNEQAKKQVLELWNSEYPKKLSYKTLTDFEEYLQKLKNLKHFLLTTDKNLIFGWAFTFDRENEKWFAIILSEKIKGQGLGSQMLDKLKQTEKILNGWVIDHDNDKKKSGETYSSPLNFYRKCGFEILGTQRLELDTISAVKIQWTESQHSNQKKHTKGRS